MRLTRNGVSQKVRTAVINLTIRLMNWNQRIRTVKREINWVDRLRWWNERLLDQVFSWAYENSLEEIESVYNGEIPPHYMSLWQKAILAQFPREDVTANCCGCRWHGTLAQAHGDLCPNCLKAVWIDPIEHESLLP